MSVRPIPVSWLQALRPGGRLVTTIAGTGLTLTADKQADGAVGQIECDRAGFMRTRHGDDYERQDEDMWKGAADGEGEHTFTSRYPLLYPEDAWDAMSMLELQGPGLIYRQDQDGESRTVWLLHPDGSWARATVAAGSWTRQWCTSLALSDCGRRWTASATGSTAVALSRSTGEGEN
ncbi:hypothetical protein ABT288_34035 [Streptomyces sp. NPDC001093]|uniref:hypothetical protein n=1 Tax=Streptomyces sp. NPDC001093 TaxID=3154376 RepID=UPI00332350D7